MRCTYSSPHCACRACTCWATAWGAWRSCAASSVTQQQPPGRVVFLGTPSMASRAANAVGRFRLGRAILGPAASEGLLYAHEHRWSQERELGIIAGTRPLSFGRLVTKFDEDNDGTVAVSETRLPGAKAHLTLPVSHTGLLLSARVAHEVGQFLEYGHFGL